MSGNDLAGADKHPILPWYRDAGVVLAAGRNVGLSLLSALVLWALTAGSWRAMRLMLGAATPSSQGVFDSLGWQHMETLRLRMLKDERHDLIIQAERLKEDTERVKVQALSEVERARKVAEQAMQAVADAAEQAKQEAERAARARAGVVEKWRRKDIKDLLHPGREQTEALDEAETAFAKMPLKACPTIDDRRAWAKLNVASGRFADALQAPRALFAQPRHPRLNQFLDTYVDREASRILG